MTSRAIAGFLIIICQILVMFVNYWFTFGLWPKSWTSFVLCSISSIALLIMSQALQSEASKDKRS